MRTLDARLGRIENVPVIPDSMLERAGALGDVHEQKVLAALEAVHGKAVVIDRPTYGSEPGSWLANMQKAAADTQAALESGAPLIFQAAFFDGEFQGYSDFLVNVAERGVDAPIYEVYDSKLARHAKIPALLQLAAYVNQLERIDVGASNTVRLVLGDQEESVHDVRDIVPVYLHRRERLSELIAGRIADPHATPWGDPRYTACGRCDVCTPEVESHRDLLLVAGMMLTQRARLIEAGITTIDALAASTGRVVGIPQRTLTNLRAQAKIQTEATPDHVPFEPFAADQLASIPAPDAGDIFFDFEGDPLYEEKQRWGLDYLFGVYGTDVGTAPDPHFTTFWAEDLAGEKQAFTDFMTFLGERRQRHPAMHVYHYASYEKTHLLSIAARHGVFEGEVDDLLRQGVLVDLYPIVRRSVRVGSHSYSIKKLEPLYMGSEHREGTASAIDSVQQFADYCDARDSDDAAAAEALRADIVQYNRYDCYSTLKLRDWLLGIAASKGITPGLPDDGVEERIPPEPDPLYLELTAVIANVAVEDRTPLEEAIALAAAAIDYHRREAKTFWQEHFARLLEPDESVWADQRGVMVMDDTQVDVIEDWHKPTPRSGISRTLRLTGTLAPGSRISVDDNPYLLYNEPYPLVEASPPRTDAAMRLGHNRVTVIGVDDDGVTITERLGSGEQHSELPIALTPPGSLNVKTQKESIHGWAENVAATFATDDGTLDATADLVDPAFDILLRKPPRGGLAPVIDGDIASAIYQSLKSLDHSYVAVQGPPGSGKTFTGSHVIARLVAAGWRVGVVAQSHATVENVLKAVIERGVPTSAVGKKARKGEETDARTWTVVTDSNSGEFLAQGGGLVFGGTAWTFTNADRIPPEAFDLLVIDEAGQFSLANAIAVSRATKNLLLLGDPQQLPQVTVGAHPEPVDEAALGWLSAGHEVLPAELGYFLPESWRMDAAMCAPVSRLSYDGRLGPASGPHAPVRSLAGLAPGLYSVPVSHFGNATRSPEEATEVVAIITRLLGSAWTEKGTTAPLDQSGFIVVAAYNAQVQTLRDALAAAGLDRVPVGTVDKFQGAEAAISIVSLAASSAAEVPRGIEFLLMPNRLNVAISRAKWAAFLVHSPALADHLPSNAANLSVLGKFIRLVGGARQ
jgi:uncharacterized protein